MRLPSLRMMQKRCESLLRSGRSATKRHVLPTDINMMSIADIGTVRRPRSGPKSSREAMNFMLECAWIADHAAHLPTTFAKRSVQHAYSGFPDYIYAGRDPMTDACQTNTYFVKSELRGHVSRNFSDHSTDSRGRQQLTWSHTIAAGCPRAGQRNLDSGRSSGC